MSSEGGSAVRVTVSARTDVGNEREINEDNFLVADLSIRSRDFGDDPRTVGPKGVVFAICDGMGGAAAGEVASDLGVETLYSSLVTATVTQTKMTRDDFSAALEAATHRAASRIHEDAVSDSSRSGMGTTLTAAALVDGHAVFAQVGDSRAYLLRRGKLTQITRDQSLVAKLVERGSLKPEDVANFEHGNIILQALGASPTVVVELTYIELSRGDRLLLCSDGLHGMVPDEEIAQILAAGSDPSATCVQLIERAKELGGHDNVTTVVAFLDGEGLRDDVGEVVVSARGGGTDLFPIPDPKNLGELLVGLGSGTAVLDAVVSATTSSQPGPVEASPEQNIPVLPAPPQLPMMEEVYEPTPVASELGMSDAPPPSSAGGVSVIAPPPSVRARPARASSSKRSSIIALAVLGCSLLAFAVILVVYETKPTPKTTAKTGEANEPSGWTSVDPATSGAPLPVPTVSSAAAPPRPEVRPRADAQAPAMRTAPAAVSSSRRGDLAPIRDDE